MNLDASHGDRICTLGAVNSSNRLDVPEKSETNMLNGWGSKKFGLFFFDSWLFDGLVRIPV